MPRGAICGVLSEVNGVVGRGMHTGTSRCVCRPLAKVDIGQCFVCFMMHSLPITKAASVVCQNYMIMQAMQKLPPRESEAYHHSGTERMRSP